MKKWKKRVRENQEILASLAIFWVIMVVILIYSIFYLNEGHLVYSLDDAYIHMAIAKNFSQHGVWGVTKEEFSSSSSSLFYSLLLSLIFLFGPNDVAPLIINLVFANLIIFAVYYIVKMKYKLPPFAVFTCLLLTIFFLPLHFLILTGMEHTIQIFFDIIFVYLATKILTDVNLHQKKAIIKRETDISFLKDKSFFLLAPLVTMVRFEGMFLIIFISFLFLLRRKYFYSILIAILGFLPIIIFGLISLYYGWYFLPNSVILKSNEIDFTFLGFLKLFLSFVDELIDNYHISILLIGALGIILISIFKKKGFWSESSIMAFIFLGVTLLHILLIGATLKNQNLSRYEGYIIALGILLLFLSIKDGLPRGLAIEHIKDYLLDIKANFKKNYLQVITTVFIIFLFFCIYIPRSYRLIRDTPQATNNIYEQQYQMGLFLEKYYEGDCIAANDIGAINYLADIEILDLRGLGSDEIAEAIQEDELDEDFVYETAKNMDCKIAIIYEDKDYGYGIPDEWTKAGEWEIRDNVVCGDDDVSFWAVEDDELDNLIKHLKDFSSELPDSVKESGLYKEVL
ncbi:MAG: hypothetical protein ACFFBP_13040 [Promethearchaeota archaeon]